MTPLLCPVWWRASAASFSRLATLSDGWRSRSSRVAASPMIPPPTIATSYITDCTLAGRGAGSARTDRLFEAQRLDRVEACGAPGRVVAEEDTDERREKDGQHDRRGIDDHRPTADRGRGDGQHRAGQDPDQAAGSRQDDGLDEKLPQDHGAACADRHADPDLPGALGDRDEHDVHDPDPADDERDG